MSDALHPLIALFEQQAAVLDAQGSKLTTDDALWKLAAWMSLVQSDLSEDDMTLLCEVGGILYREGLHKRTSGDSSS